MVELAGGEESNSDMLEIRGVQIYRHYLSEGQQRVALGELRDIAARAPLFSPMTPYGKKMSVRMTSAGRYGWYSDRRGYRYIERHPSGMEWPQIPDSIMAVWTDLVSSSRQPDCCLINFYDESAKMGMHRDSDERDFSWPVVSISLGDEARFRIGNLTRGGRTESIWLRSGDVALLSGSARLIYHGIDRIRFNSSRLLEKGGRINLTLRVVD